MRKINEFFFGAKEFHFAFLGYYLVLGILISIFILLLIYNVVKFA